MTQLVKFLECKDEDLSSGAQHPSKNLSTAVCVYNLCAGSQRQADPWSSLASQLIQIGKAPGSIGDLVSEIKAEARHGSTHL